MAFAFDTLGYAKKLREAGVEPKIAEAHAEAARDFVMAELVTKTDLAATREQADAIAGVFEVLSNQIGDLRVWQRVHTALLVLILAAVLAPYVAMLFR